MGIWKAIKRTVGVGLLAATMGCSAPNTVGPVESRAVNFNKTLFANQGTLYRPSITGSYDEMKWKIGNGTQVTGVDVYANDSGHGDLELKLFKAGKECDSVSVDQNRVYKGEVTTDGEVNSTLTAKVGAGKVNGGYLTNFVSGSYEWDAGFVRTSDAEVFWVYAIGTNDEKNDIPTTADIPVTDSLLVINEEEDIATTIDAITP